MNYDLENRTKKFAVEILMFCKELKITYLNKALVDQLIRSSTSVGANYREANGASSRKDFTNKIYLCRKEIQETEYWLELLGKIESNIDKLKALEKEARELTLIFNKISHSLKNSKN